MKYTTLRFENEKDPSDVCLFAADKKKTKRQYALIKYMYVSHSSCEHEVYNPEI